jgi:tRNA 2-thiouridine synthesizing protein A
MHEMTTRNRRCRVSTRIMKLLDLRGVSAPSLVVAASVAVVDLSADDLLEIRITDRWSIPEFGEWCDTSGHALVERSESEGVFRFVIRKT